MTVAQLTDTMDSEEFLAWRTLAEIEAEEAERAERGEAPQQPKRQVVTDPAEIQRWFSVN